MLPQRLVYKNELNREYVITLARNDETPWWWSEKIEICRSGFKCFKWKLYRCIFWLIVEVILRNTRCNDEMQSNKSLVSMGGGESGIPSEASGYSSLRVSHCEILQSSLIMNFSLTCRPVKFILKSIFNCFLSCWTYKFNIPYKPKY